MKVKLIDWLLDGDPAVHWMRNSGMSDLIFLEMEIAGFASRINTLRVLSVILWRES
ncbi:MAG: hypothetical protein ABFS03_01415 [Chloroflexota bacterium]